MKKFEIPYNFDIGLLRSIDALELTKFVGHIFLSSYKDRDARSGMLTGKTLEHNSMYFNYPKDRTEYEGHIKAILKYIPNICILFQFCDFNKDKIKYYTDLGVTGFIVGSQELGYEIKSFDSNLYVNASIVNRFSYQDIIYKDMSMFDSICLHFPFVRAIDILKALPSSYRYLILVNSNCAYDCEAIYHWNNPMHNTHICECGSDKSILLNPTDLDIYDDYIWEYKLQGREYNKLTIIHNLISYAYRLNEKYCGVIHDKTFFNSALNKTRWTMLNCS